jgi:hypothetical protein
MTSKILRFLLIAIMVILAISGLAGGINLIADPSGDSLQLTTFLLGSTLFSNFLIPGFILLIFLGIFPILVAYGLITKSKSKAANRINLYKKRHWAWTYSLYCGIILVLWIDIQVMLIGGGYTLQTVYAILGVLIIILTLSPEVMRFYKLKK